jgi:predicted transcriptional regulator
LDRPVEKRMAGRSILEIQIHLMEILRGKTMRKTELMYKANLTWELLNRAMFDLSASKLIDESRGWQHLTEEGIKCLELLERGITMIRPLRSVFQDRGFPRVVKDSKEEGRPGQD